MLNEKNEFDIQVKDNFLNKKDFEKVINYMKTIQWNAKDLHYEQDTPEHHWFNKDCPKEISDIILKEVIKFFKVKILKESLCQYTFVSKSEKNQIHNDAGDRLNFQIILYLEGDQNIHCGTGFYSKKQDNSFELNTHIGFKPNRVVSWVSNVYHAPLNFTDDFKSRKSIIAQYLVKEIRC